jgi:membrane protein implicated in regulation of membrane protease activity
VNILKRRIKNRYGSPLTGVFLACVSLGVLLVYLLSQNLEIGPFGLLLAIVAISTICDFALAWNHEKAVREGKVRLWHDMVGRSAVVSEAFVRDGQTYQGRILLGYERWSARSQAELTEGDSVHITGREGLVLRVKEVPRPLSDRQRSESCPRGAPRDCVKVPE